MKNFLSLLLATALIASSCSSSKSTQSFGEKFEPNKPASVNQGIRKLQSTPLVAVKGIGDEDKMGLPIQMEGKVKDVCQAKGCWMNIQDAEGHQVFVRFKDYKFFMPKDLAGKSVVITGNFYSDVTSVEDQRHYAEDKGATQAELDAIKEPKTEYKFYASGVVVKD